MSRDSVRYAVEQMSGIYTILGESGEFYPDGHKKYNVRCNVCGFETCMGMANIKRSKRCSHPKELPDKYCLQCGELIPKNWIYSEYVKRKFCNQSCAAIFNNKQSKRNNSQRIQQEQVCVNCGAEIISGNHVRRKFCSNRCQNDYNYYEWIRKWLSGEIDGFSNSLSKSVSHHIRRYLYEKYDSKCSVCGWGETNPFTGKIPLEIEHIDGNHENNRPHNVTLLCPNCHSLTSTYKGANRGNGREYRRIRYHEIKGKVS